MPGLDGFAPIVTITPPVVYPDESIPEGLFRWLTELGTPPIAWPDVPFTPPASGGWLVPTVLPAPTDPFALEHTGSEVRRGVFQVSIFFPKSEGVLTALNYADAIAVLFSQGERRYQDGIEIKVDAPPIVAAPVEEPDWHHVPVSIQYFAAVPGDA